MFKKISIAVSVLLIAGCSHPTYTAQPSSYPYTAPQSNYAPPIDKVNDRFISIINKTKSSLTQSQLLLSKHKELLNNVCKNEKPATASKDAMKCSVIYSVITHSLPLEEALKNTLTSKDVVNPNLVSAISEFGTMYSIVWSSAIERESISDAYGSSGSSLESLDAKRASQEQTSLGTHEALDLASTSLVELDVPQKILTFENNLQKTAKKSGKKEFLDLAVKFHTLVDLNLNPRGSLIEYKKQLQDATTKFEEAKTLLSLTK